MIIVDVIFLFTRFHFQFSNLLIPILNKLYSFNVKCDSWNWNSNQLYIKNRFPLFQSTFNSIATSFYIENLKCLNKHIWIDTLSCYGQIYWGYLPRNTWIWCLHVILPKGSWPHMLIHYFVDFRLHLVFWILLMSIEDDSLHLKNGIKVHKQKWNYNSKNTKQFSNPLNVSFKTF